jgi:hypothetical protein
MHSVCVTLSTRKRSSPSLTVWMRPVVIQRIQTVSEGDELQTKYKDPKESRQDRQAASESR